MNNSSTNIMDLPTDPSIGQQQIPVQMISGGIAPQTQQTPQLQQQQSSQPFHQMVQQVSPQPLPPQIQQSSLDPSTASELLQSIAMASQKGATDLPSRDIPVQTQHLVQDVQITPNYIPPVNNRDYIDEEEETNERMLEQAARKDRNEKQMDALYAELQIPLLVAILYFLFQLPFFNKLLYAYVPRLFTEDGQKNIYGYFFMSALFGILYYILTKSLQIVS